MLMKNLRRLAKEIFLLTRHDVWLAGSFGGRGEEYAQNPGPWPQGLRCPWEFGTDRRYRRLITWSLSPEVEIGEWKLRVSVSWSGHSNDNINVIVYVNGGIHYPGGAYSVGLPFFFSSWEQKIAAQERIDGGQSSRVEARGDLLKSLKLHRRGVRTQHDTLYCDACKTALDELDDC